MKTGKNPKLFNKIESITMIKKLQPLYDGGRSHKLRIDDKDRPDWKSGGQLDSTDRDDNQD